MPPAAGTSRCPDSQSLGLRKQQRLQTLPLPGDHGNNISTEIDQIINGKPRLQNYSFCYRLGVTMSCLWRTNPYLQLTSTIYHGTYMCLACPARSSMALVIPNWTSMSCTRYLASSPCIWAQSALLESPHHFASSKYVDPASDPMTQHSSPRLRSVVNLPCLWLLLQNAHRMSATTSPPSLPG